MYLDNKEVPKALDFLKLSAKLGNTNAMHSMGVIYYKGYGVNSDKEKAVSYFESAAEQGNEKSKTILKELNN